MRQPSWYELRATSEYGQGLTIARISACRCLSTTGFEDPPPSSPQTRVTSVPLSTSTSTIASDRYERSLWLYPEKVETPIMSPSWSTLSYGHVE